MPSHLIRTNLDLVYPRFVEPMLEALAAAEKRGAPYFWTCAYRAWAESDRLHALYSEGLGPRAAPGGSSAHNFGAGGDFTRDGDAAKPGLQPSWKVADYAILKEEVERVGLVSGGSFGDWPHVNYPGCTTGAELAPLRKVWRATDPKAPELERLQAVWAHLDTLPQPSRKDRP